MADEEIARLEAELQAAYDVAQASRAPQDIQALRDLQARNIPRLQELRPPPPAGPGDVVVVAGDVHAGVLVPTPGQEDEPS